MPAVDPGELPAMQMKLDGNNLGSIQLGPGPRVEKRVPQVQQREEIELLVGSSRVQRRCDRDSLLQFGLLLCRTISRSDSASSDLKK